jgi:hypothetical protein
MQHKRFEEWLQLVFYNELTKQEKASLNNHMKVCTQCRTEYKRMREFFTLVSHNKPIINPELLLQDARRNLRLRLHKETKYQSLWIKVKDAFEDFLTPQLQVALGGVAILAIGIFVGYLVFQSPEEKSLAFRQTASMSSAVEAGESQISNVRFIDRNAQTGVVEFTFETLTPVRIRGNVNDENIQKVLARALVTGQNPGVRLRAASIIGNQAGTPELDADVKVALIEALQHDQNLGVRKEALKVLRNYLPDPTIVRAFLSVLANEKNTGLKIAVINSLDLSQYENQPVNQEILSMFKNRVQSDDNNYIRIRAKAALQEVKQ